VLVEQMAVDIEQGMAVAPVLDDVGVPDLVVEVRGAVMRPQTIEAGGVKATAGRDAC
jgi:hypothetical protein